ncbi:hypothetical protein [Hoeflea sp. TYP-13]|uniref:hypothetical protein n=1 Tax=Hoeflea sp. TYP-13 TaxID=3230023 RepID=UPI0034C638B6
MADLITLVGALYACNIMAEQSPVSLRQAYLCVQSQEAVKLRLLSADEISDLEGLSLAERNRIKLRGYRRFKTWEAENPDLVRQIRREEKQKLLFDG